MPAASRGHERGPHRHQPLLLLRGAREGRGAQAHQGRAAECARLHAQATCWLPAHDCVCVCRWQYCVVTEAPKTTFGKVNHTPSCVLACRSRACAHRFARRTRASSTASRYVSKVVLLPVATHVVFVLQDDLAIAIQLAMIGCQKFFQGDDTRQPSTHSNYMTTNLSSACAQIPSTATFESMIVSRLASLSVLSCRGSLRRVCAARLQISRRRVWPTRLVLLASCRRECGGVVS